MKKYLHTVLRVVILSTLVGRRTGPLTRSCLSFARLMRSFETITILSNKDRFMSTTLTFLQVLHVAAREGDANFVDFGGGNGSRSIIVLLSFGDVTHVFESDGDCNHKNQRN